MIFKKTYLIAIVTLVISCKKEVPYKNNSIASAHPLASKAGVKMYKLGGNAADAAVAAAFTLAVVEPSMSGIGGRLQAIVRSNNRTIGIDASTVVPKNFKNNSKDNEGYKTIGIPGVVAGLIEIHRNYGILDIATVMEPAISHAENGFMLLKGEAYRQSLTKESLLLYQGSSSHFLNLQGKTLDTSALFIQKDLAWVLKKIRDFGAKGFYEGEVAQKMSEDIQKNGGFLSLEDLKKYEVKKSKILSTNYKGFKIESLYLPSYGAITINILNILNEFDLSSENEEQDIIVTNEAIRIAYEKRKYQNIPDSLESILSKEKSFQSAQKIKQNSRIISKSDENTPGSWTAKIGHTTHLTTADKNGLVISLTQTIGPLMGSKVATKGLGFLYAVTMGGYLGDYKPGDRANSHISPTLVSKNGEVFMALGAAGGNKIVTAVAQTIKNKIDLNLSLEEAVARGRIFPDKDSIQIEAHKGIIWKKNTLSTLEKKGYEIKLIDKEGFNGRINAVILDTILKKWKGVSDPDWEGQAIDY